MLLRSSSTPIFGSLLASSSSSSSYFSESPSHGPVPNPLERALSDSHNKLSFPPNPTNHHHHHLNSSSSFHGCSLHLSSPVVDPPVGFRRVQSEGNLKNLAAADLPPPAKSHRRPSPVLETIPSFSLYSSRLERGLEHSVAEEEDELEEEELAEDSSEFVPRSFAGEKGRAAAMGSPLFLAKGLGLENFGGAAASELILGMGGTGSNGGGGGVGGRSVHVDSSGSQADMEAYYKKMVEEDPGNSLLLRNYAQFLHKSKRDLKRAEEYYSRAVLAEPGDGEVLSQYAMVIWELHHDRGRAGGYFEQAVQAAPQNSHVLASYANFLWEAEDDEEEEGEEPEEELFGGAKVPVMAHPRSLSC